MSPERFLIEEFRIALDHFQKAGDCISFVVIDETHCVSEWGHDFRTSYLKLGSNAFELIKTTSGQPIALFGLTATASFDVLADVERELNTPKHELDPEAVVRFENSVRNEIQYVIKEVYIVVQGPDNPTPPSSCDGVIQLNADQSLMMKDKENPSQAVNRIIGQAKQNALFKLFKEISSEYARFNDDSVISEVCERAFEEFTTEEFRQGVTKNEYVQKNLSNIIERKELEPFFNQYCTRGAIVFGPHRGGWLGVTDRYKLTRQDGEQVQLPGSFWKGFVDRLEQELPNHSFGMFLGSGDLESSYYQLDTERIEQESFDNQHKFVNNKISIMGATKAFGMGIDKENIRLTVHMNFPSLIESFVQESGRAGRDRKLSLSFVLFTNLSFNYLKPSRRILTYLFGRDLANELSDLKGKLFLDSDFESKLENIFVNSPQKLAQFKELNPPEHSDRRVLDFFLKNSFKGEEKETMMCWELLWDIKLPFAESLTQCLDESEGLENYRANIWQKKNKLRIYINDHKDAGVGYISLPDMSVRPFGTSCQENVYVLATARDKLEERFQIHEFQPFKSLAKQACEQGKISSTPGILQVLEMEFDGSREIKIPFTNLFQSDNAFVIYELEKYFKKHFDKHVGEERIRQLFVESRPETFEHLLREVKAELDVREVSEKAKKRLKYLFYCPRQANDTDKAIYRLSSIGVIDDYVVDYNRKHYRVWVSKKPRGTYKKNYQLYLQRYLSKKQAKRIVDQIDLDQEDQEIWPCILSQLKFVYSQIFEKRKRSIEDMQELCLEGLDNNKRESNLRLKEYLFLYFNSKYARRGYEVDGKNYSLWDDVGNSASQRDFKLVTKYVEILEKDPTGGYIDNIKHLRGACRRLLRANPKNDTLLLLSGFTYFILASTVDRAKPRLLSEGLKNFLDGFLIFVTEEGLSLRQLENKINEIKSWIVRHADDSEVIEAFDDVTATVQLRIHNLWLETEFKPRFIPND